MIIKNLNKSVLAIKLADILSIIACLSLAFFLRFGGNIPCGYLSNFPLFVFIFILVKFSLLSFSGLYRIEPKYTGLADILAVLRTGIYSLFIFTGLIYLNFRFLSGFPKAVLFIDFVIWFVAASGIRLSKRIWAIYLGKKPTSGERILIIGAGDAGEQLIRNILERKNIGLIPIGFVDDDPGKKNAIIHGVRVLGGRRDLSLLIRKFHIDIVIIAMPSAASVAIKEAIEYSHRAGVSRISILPSLLELLDGRVGLNDVRDIQLSDFLGRPQIKINTDEIGSYLKGKSLLVTGAAGSIGAELCHQVLKFFPQNLIMLDIDETRIFDLYNELKYKFPHADIIYKVADVRDSLKIDGIFSENKPQLVFHAAAYKHVPVMEMCPEEAVNTNIFGTQSVAQCALKYQCEKFILISTDKAVNPSSVMGATKRVSELLIEDLNHNSKTKFISVRFGNVLESRGNMFSIFSQQIKERRAVTITDPEMQRYIMSIFEAVLLVLQAVTIADSGEIFTLDIGKPVKIIDFARQMIRFYGYEVDKEIPIVFIGARPGEKMSEEYIKSDEQFLTSRYENILITKTRRKAADSQGLKVVLEELRANCQYQQADKIICFLKRLVPEFKPQRG